MKQSTDFIKQFNNEYIETNEIKRQNIYEQMAQLKDKQVKLIR